MVRVTMKDLSEVITQVKLALAARGMLSEHTPADQTYC
jgi:hypothetical protein